jgi:hypothetical protein
LARFRDRNKVRALHLHGEGGDVAKDDPVLLAALADLAALVATYRPECVYNMDETGLFYRIQPRYTLLAPSEEPERTRGKKLAKERVSAIICANADGTVKIPVVIVGKAARPTCVAHMTWPTPYRHQNKAWVDKAICWDWFDSVFVPSVRAVTSEAVLLVLDNAPGHFDAFERDGIRVTFLPPNCTSWRQPMDLGVIAALKKRYKYLLLRDVIKFVEKTALERRDLLAAANQMRAGAAGVAYGRPAHVLDAATYIAAAWDAVTPATIKSAYTKADIGVAFGDSQLRSTDDIDIAISSLVESFTSASIEETLEYVHVDDRDSEEYISEVVAEFEF